VSAGQLSSDQARFAQRVAAGTGLHPTVVTAWVGAESGWGVTKPTHNYLNVRNVGAGGFAAYESVDQAADRVIGLIRNSRYYEGVRGAIPRGPVPQVQAIIASPWDAGHYSRPAGNLLERTFAGVVAAGGAILAGWDLPDLPDLPGPLPNLPNLPTIPSPTEAAEQVAGLLGLDDLGRQVLVAGLGLIFTLAAFGIITLGLQRLSGGSPRKTLEQVASVVGAGTGAGKALSAVT
jgi:hypothetical protein